MPAFEAALGAWLELRRTDTGIQLVATFRRPTDDRRFAAAAIAAGVNVSPFSLQFRHGGATPGLVLGFAATGARAQDRGLSRLAGVAAQLATGERRAQPHGHRRASPARAPSPWQTTAIPTTIIRSPAISRRL